MKEELCWIRPVLALIAGQAMYAVAMFAVVGRPASPPLGFYFVASSVLITMIGSIFVLITLGKLSFRRDELSIRSVATAFVKNRRKLIVAVIGLQLFTVSAGFMTWTKAMIPYAIGFRWDTWLADADKAIFRADPWVYTTPWMNILEPFYSSWFATMMIVFVGMCMAPASEHRRIVLVAFFGTWALGTLIASLLPAAGPIFFERIGLGSRFDALQLRPVYQWEADYLWAAHVSGNAGAAIGISAMPSMHVAMTAWMAFAVRPWRWLFWPAVVFVLLIWLGSVGSGWHYSLDGLVGLFVAAAAFAISKRSLEVPLHQRPARMSLA